MAGVPEVVSIQVAGCDRLVPILQRFLAFPRDPSSVEFVVIALKGFDIGVVQVDPSKRQVQLLGQRQQLHGAVLSLNDFPGAAHFHNPRPISCPVLQQRRQLLAADLNEYGMPVGAFTAKAVVDGIQLAQQWRAFLLMGTQAVSISKVARL